MKLAKLFSSYRLLSKLFLPPLSQQTRMIKLSRQCRLRGEGVGRVGCIVSAEGHILQHFGAQANAFDKAFVRGLGIFMGGFMSVMAI